MKAQACVIKVVGIPVLPGRCLVNAEIDEEAVLGSLVDGVVDASNWPWRFTCLDCGFRSESADAMLAHRTGYRHTLWQRVRRFFNLATL